MNAKRILYAGDTSLEGAAAYLAGILTHAGLAFDYASSDEPLSPHLAKGEPILYIISDYPVKNIAAQDFATLAAGVRSGAGLLMIGGWESFHGLAGEYPGTPLAEVLPVEMQPADDRVNSAQPCLIERVADHAIVDGLPFDRPPGIGGYNRFVAKPDAETILLARHVAVVAEQGGNGTSYTFTPGEASPLLVLGSFGEGRTAALATDVAPHWVGGFVDWGDTRVTAQAPGAGDIEVGSWYAEFFTRLVRWAMGNL